MEYERSLTAEAIADGSLELNSTMEWIKHQVCCLLHTQKSSITFEVQCSLLEEHHVEPSARAACTFGIISLISSAQCNVPQLLSLDAPEIKELWSSINRLIQQLVCDPVLLPHHHS